MKSVVSKVLFLLFCFVGLNQIVVYSDYDCSTEVKLLKLIFKQLLVSLYGYSLIWCFFPGYLSLDKHVVRVSEG